MRIAVWHNLPTGGGLRAMVDHVTGLQQRGHEVVVHCPPEAAGQSPGFAPGTEVRTFALPLRLTHRSWPALPPAPVVRDRLSAMERHLTAVAADVNGQHFDVLYAGSCRYLRAVGVARHVDLPSVLYLQEPYRWLYEALPRLPWLESSPYREPANVVVAAKYRLAAVGWQRALRAQATRELSAARAFDRVLVNSSFSRESVLRAYGFAPSVCRLGVDAARFEVTAPEPAEPYVVGLGAVVPEKNIEAAVTAVASVTGRRPRLVWVGNVADQRYAASVTSLAATMGVNLELRVAVPDQELALLLAGSVALLYAPRLEPFGYAPLEAAACGRPTVGVAEGGVRETVQDGLTGLLVDHESELGAALQRLVDDPALADALGHRAREVVAEKWSLAGSVAEVERHLLAAAGRS